MNRLRSGKNGIDNRYIREAIGLALKAEGLTSPNPIVGAVIVKGGKVVGRGYHKGAGLPHAEVYAIRQAGAAARGSTLYVTLEPCDHYGRTPPCTDSIIKAGIKKVVAGTIDSNPVNSGRGMAKLRKHGIRASVSAIEKEALSINRPYVKFITKNIPYVTVKVAESLDGKIAAYTGDSKWITSEESRRYVHNLRAKVDAVIVGANTILNDDPLLTNRSRGGKQPIRIVVDSNLKTPLKSRIFSDIKKSPVIIATAVRSGLINKYERKGAKVVVAGDGKGRVDLKALLKILARDGIMHVMVEGGGELIASFIEKELVDRFLFFIAPKIIGGRTAVTSVEGSGVRRVTDSLILKNVTIRRFSQDFLIEGYSA